MCGYTHYWSNFAEISPNVWGKFIEDFNKVLPAFVDLLDSETNQKLAVSNEIVYFNGIGEEAHETFGLERLGVKDFDFCKTAEKPYDLAVCSALIIAAHHFGDDIKVSSDGDIEDEWKASMRLCQTTLGYGSDFKFDEDDED